MQLKKLKNFSLVLRISVLGILIRQLAGKIVEKELKNTEGEKKENRKSRRTHTCIYAPGHAHCCIGNMCCSTPPVVQRLVYVICRTMFVLGAEITQLDCYKIQINSSLSQGCCFLQSASVFYAASEGQRTGGGTQPGFTLI